MTTTEDNTGSRGRPCIINLNLLPVKGTYFFLLGAIAVLLPYLPVYMHELHLTPIETAIILSVVTAFCALIRAVVGIIADKLQQHKAILMMCCFICGVFHFCLYFVPPEIESMQTLAYAQYGLNSTCNRTMIDFCISDKAQDEQAKDLFLNEIWKVDNSSNLTIAKTNTLSESCVLKCCLSGGEVSRQSNFLGNVSTVNNETCSSLAWLNLNNSKESRKNLVGFCGSSSLEGSDLKMLVEKSELCDFVQERNCNLVCEDKSASIVYPRYQKTFIIFFILYFVAQAALSPIFSILDSIIFTYLGDERNKFGKQRLWGTVSFGIFAISGGYIVDLLKANEIQASFLFSFITFLIFMVLSGLVVFGYRNVPEIVATDVCQNFCVLLCNFYLMIIIASVFVGGFLAGILEGFFFYFMDSLGSDKLIMGIALLVACICEVIVLFFSGRIIKLIGHSRCLYLVFFTFFVRLLSNSYIYDPWWAVGTEWMQCVCFGLLYPTVSAWASALAPPGMQGTVQSLIGAVYFSLGRAAGAGIGGVIYEIYSPRIMFRVYAIIAIVFMFVLIFLFEVVDKRRVKTEKSDKQEEAEGFNEKKENSAVGNGKIKSLDTEPEFLSMNGDVIEASNDLGANENCSKEVSFKDKQIEETSPMMNNPC